MRDYGTPEGLPTRAELWAKLTGNDKKAEFTLTEFQKAMDKVMEQTRRG